MNKKNPKVDAYLKNAQQWQAESKKLRTILLDCGLTEELKWGQPCYTFEKSNIAIIQGFKDFCALMFFKGALLKDPAGVLQLPGENSRSARRIPFTQVSEITKLAATLKAYVEQAKEVETAGLKVKLEPPTKANYPEEFQSKLASSRALKTAFEALTPGRQRAYLLHFSAPKQAQTRESRIEKCRQRILAGLGLNDR